jgi:hypothetical protein
VRRTRSGPPGCCVHTRAYLAESGVPGRKNRPGTPGSTRYARIDPVRPQLLGGRFGPARTWRNRVCQVGRTDQVRPNRPGTSAATRWPVRPRAYLAESGVPGRKNRPATPDRPGTPESTRNARNDPARPKATSPPGRAPRPPGGPVPVPWTGTGPPDHCVCTPRVSGGIGRTWSEEPTRYARIDPVRPERPGTPGGRYERLRRRPSITGVAVVCTFDPE